jgi:hypothetical protein
MNDLITFGALDKLLKSLRFTRTVVSDSSVAYEHRPSDTLLALRPQPPAEEADPRTLIIVRKMLVERGLIEPDAFEKRVRKLSA